MAEITEVSVYEEFNGEWKGVCIFADDGRWVWEPWITFTHEHVAEAWEEFHNEKCVVVDCAAEGCLTCRG